MNLQELFKDIWSMMKDNIKLITVITVILTILMGLGLYLVNTISTPSHDDIVEEEERLIKIGTIDLYADESLENISLYPSLPRDVINEINEWSKFSGDFSLTLNGNSELDFSNFPIDPDEEYNPVESFLGLEDVSRGGYIYDEETGDYYFTVKVDPETGNMTAVNSNYGVSDYLIDLDITDETSDQKFESIINEDSDSILDISYGMDPGGGRLMRFETFYNWQYGVSYPRSFSNKKNFYVYNPSPYDMIANNVSNVSLSISSILKYILSFLLLSLLISVAIVFIKNLLSPKISYSFTYGWSSKDLYLKYDSNDTYKQIAFDMLQSASTELAVVSQYELDNEIQDESNAIDTKNVTLVQDITELPINKSIEEFIVVIKRQLTEKEWYQKQRKHIKAYKDVSVKIIEL